MHSLKLRRGTTLPEVVTVAFSSVLLLAGLVAMGVNAATEWSFGSSKLMADNDVSIAVQKLCQDARNGIRATVANGNTELTVVMPAANAQGDYDRFTDGPSIRYYLSNGSLYRQEGTNTATVLAKKVTSVQFTLSGPQVQIQVRSLQQMGTRLGDTTLRTQVTLRNEPT